MKLLNFVLHSAPHLGILLPDGVLDVSALSDSLPKSTDEVIKAGQAMLQELRAISKQEHPLLPEKEITYAPAVLAPALILCVGLNYQDHIKESREAGLKAPELPKDPVWFNKFQRSLIGHRQPIRLCPSASQHDSEAELCVIIGKKGRDIKKEDAHKHLFGYTLGNDFSARDLQMRSGQWLIGKACDTFGPLGPVVVTKDAIAEKDLDIKGTINGEVRQNSHARNMVFDIPTLIADVSRFFTLSPGDVIFTGTPQGVIMGRKPPLTQEYLKAGDVVTVSSSQIGVLVNPVI